MRRARSAKKKIAEILQLCDLGTPETRRQGNAELFYTTDPETKRTERRARITNQFAIDRLRIHKVITHRQFEAGNRLKNDWYLAKLTARVTCNLLGAGGGAGAGEMSDMSIGARQRVRNALGKLRHHEMRVVIWVCWFDKMSEWVGRRLGANCERSAKEHGADAIRSALAALADVYGMPDD